MGIDRREEKKKIDLDGEKCTIHISVEQFGSRVSQSLLTQIFKLITKYASSIGSIGGATSTDGEGASLLDRSVDFEKIGLALYANIDEDEFLTLVLALMERTEVQFDTGKKDGKSKLYTLSDLDHYDECFAGNLTLQIDVMQFIFKVNYNDFLSRWRMSKARKKVMEFVDLLNPKKKKNTKELPS